MLMILILLFSSFILLSFLIIKYMFNHEKNLEKFKLFNTKTQIEK